MNLDEKNRHIVIFHASCADGFCSAAILYDVLVYALKDPLLIPAHYGDPVPSDLDLNSDDIIFLADFSYNADIIYELSKIVKHIFIFDHHKTAEEELKKLKIPNVTVFFDMNRSGAMLVFDFITYTAVDTKFNINFDLFKEEDFTLPKSNTKFVPELVKYVQDRDLWKFELPHSKEISMYLRSIDFNPTDWGRLLDPVIWDTFSPDFVGEGRAILRFQKGQVKSAVDHAVEINFPLFPGATQGMPVRIVNTTVNHSEIGEALCVNYNIPFAVTWFYRSDGKFQYSLRSQSGYDVSKVAEAYGGGGHLAAAGFSSDVMIKEV